MSKKRFLMLLMITFMIGMFMNVRGVSAEEYASGTCNYAGTFKLNHTNHDVSFKVQYTEKGKLSLPEKIDIKRKTTGNCNPTASGNGNGCQEYYVTTDQYPVVNVNLKASSFISGKSLKAVCPGNNDLDYYVDSKKKKIYVAWDQKSLETYLNKQGIKYDNDSLYKAGLGSSSFKRGNKIVIDGKTYDVTKGRECKYKNEDKNWTIDLELDKKTGEVLSANFNGEGIYAPISRIEGSFSPKRCPKSISASGSTGAALDLGDITNGTKRIIVYRSSSEGKHKFTQDIEEQIDQDVDDAPDVNPIKLDGELKGCALWGSLLTFLNSYVYGTIKFVLLGLLIVMGMLDFSKAVFSDNADAIKKAGSKFAKRVIIVVLFFLLPIIIDTLLGWFLPEEAIDTCLQSFK